MDGCRKGGVCCASHRCFDFYHWKSYLENSFVFYLPFQLNMLVIHMLLIECHQARLHVVYHMTECLFVLIFPAFPLTRKSGTEFVIVPSRTYVGFADTARVSCCLFSKWLYLYQFVKRNNNRCWWIVQIVQSWWRSVLSDGLNWIDIWSFLDWVNTTDMLHILCCVFL